VFWVSTDFGLLNCTHEIISCSLWIGEEVCMKRPTTTIIKPFSSLCLKGNRFEQSKKEARGRDVKIGDHEHTQITSRRWSIVSLRIHLFDHWEEILHINMKS